MKITDEEIMASFIHERQVPLFNDISTDVQKNVCGGIFYLNTMGNSPITLFIDSCGGKTAFGEYVCDAIRNSRAPVEGIVIGEASSMAFIVLQACAVRKAYEHARFMFHECRSTDVRYRTANKEKEELRKLDEEALRRIAQRSGVKIAQIRTWMRESRWFDSTEALHYGFIDEIVTPPPFPLRSKQNAAATNR